MNTQNSRLAHYFTMVYALEVVMSIVSVGAEAVEGELLSISSQSCPVTSLWYLEIGPGDRVYTTDVGT